MDDIEEFEDRLMYGDEEVEGVSYDLEDPETWECSSGIFRFDEMDDEFLGNVISISYNIKNTKGLTWLQGQRLHNALLEYQKREESKELDK